MRTRFFCAGLCGLALSLILAGCGGSSSGTTSSSNLSDDTQGAAAGIASDTVDMASGLTQADATASIKSDIADANQTCPDITVNSTGSDGKWTSETLTYANPPCGFSGFRGRVSFSITGAVDLTRSSDNDMFDFSKNVQNLEYSFTINKSTESETRNGTRVVTADASSASLAGNMSVVFDGTRHDGTLSHQLALTFTPASGSTLEKGQPLPDGTINVSGNANWTGTDGNARTYVVTTVTPLAYDATCKNVDPSVFDSGELQVQVSGNKNATATITWANCQDPTITYTGN